MTILDSLVENLTASSQEELEFFESRLDDLQKVLEVQEMERLQALVNDLRDEVNDELSERRG